MRHLRHRNLCTPAEALARLRQAMPAAVALVLDRLVAAGGRPVLVGGAVRDVFCGVAPGDWDIAVNLSVKTVVGAFDRVVRHGEKHGTVMLIVKGLPVEVSSFRAGGDGNTDGGDDAWARALHNDLMHRDFTMNAMAADMSASQIIDPFDGCGDLNRGLLRCVEDPAERLREDPLRALRAARFVAERGFTPAAGTKSALVGVAVDAPAAERRRDEVVRMLGGADPLSGLRLLQRAGLLQRLLPPLAPLTTHGWPALRRIASQQPYGRWIFWAWCHGCAPEDFRALLLELRVSRARVVRSGLVLEALGRLAPGRPPREAALRHWMVHDPVAATAAAALAELRWPRSYAGFAAAAADAAAHACLNVSRLAVDGDALLRRGVPARYIGRVLQQLLQWVCDAPSRNARQALLQHTDKLYARLRADA